MPVVTHRLTLPGHAPSKKNANRPSGRGRQMHMDPAIAGYIKALEWEARMAWGDRPAIEHPAAIRATFFVRDGRADLDSKYTSIQDVLVKARVIRNDSIARVRKFSCEAHIDAHERVQVEIDEA